MIPHATVLSTSQYGRFFARKLNLHLLERRPDEWRHAQLGVVHHFAHQKRAAGGKTAGITSAPIQVDSTPAPEDADAVARAEKKKRKREAKAADAIEGGDEIDALFAAEGKRSKKKV